MCLHNYGWIYFRIISPPVLETSVCSGREKSDLNHHINCESRRGVAQCQGEEGSSCNREISKSRHRRARERDCVTSQYVYALFTRSPVTWRNPHKDDNERLRRHRLLKRHLVPISLPRFCGVRCVAMHLLVVIEIETVIGKKVQSSTVPESVRT